MRTTKTLALLAGLAGVAALSGCGPKYYTVIGQQMPPSPAVQQATAFKVRPLDLSRIRFTDLGFKDMAAFRTDFDPVPTAFQEAFGRFWAEVGIAPRNLQFVGAQDPVTEGILLEVSVDRIQLNWSIMSNRPDQFFVTITFTDMVTKTVLYRSQVDVNNRAYFGR
jgi:hypothetical protein